MVDLRSLAKFTQFAVTEPVAGVVHVEINRPRALNSFSTTTWTQYGDLLAALDAAEPPVRAIVLSGAGPHFTAGLNLKEAVGEFEALPSRAAQRAAQLYASTRAFQAAISTAARIRPPVIAVAHGVCYGLAIDIMVACAVRIAAADARLSIKEIQVGFAADIGTLQRIGRLTGNQSAVAELALTGRDFGATEAADLGLVSAVHDTKEAAVTAALELATAIAKASPPAIYGTKRALVEMTEEAVPVDTGLDRIAKYNSRAIDASVVDGLRKRASRL
ncbi:ClpP/crotonase-like domain-containing protein [Dipodascopsis tothii]|uniref:ClpP/crotonase-like domain-containing protein n=1 Tax=Dipodascopsis tothii TaxID=44089 RepID=UPI0034CE5090